jgi:hypothetical protein
MNFPGDNTITLSRETIEELIRGHVASIIGDNARITSLTVDASYGNLRHANVIFTTDPEADKD